MVGVRSIYIGSDEAINVYMLHVHVYIINIISWLFIFRQSLSIFLGTYSIQTYNI